MGRRAVVAVMALVLAVLAAACGGTDPVDDGTEAATPTATTDPSTGEATDATDRPSFAERLALLPPVGEDQAQVVLGDLDRAAALAGVTAPSDPADEAAIPYLLAISGGPTADGDPSQVVIPLPTTAHPERAAQIAEFAAEVGWSAIDLDWYAEVSAPPAVTMVAGGDVTPDDLTAAIGEPDDDLWAVGGGEPFAPSLEDTTPARPIGEPLWLTLADGVLGVARSPESLDALRGGGASAADDEGLLALAELADDRECLGAHIALGPGDPVMWCPLSQAEPARTALLAARLADEASAAAEVARVAEVLTGSASQSGQPYVELFSSTDVSQDERLVVLELEIAADRPADLPLRMLFLRDPAVPGGG
ncbi:hypothetical protein [Euzebya sp.]|uniref:hypothetical protein n=1 Tax=Euzebya sp. TaxID=1971409 RepID=UPI00351410F0